MPLAHVEWFMKQSVHDSDQIHARQCCAYYSITNVNKTNYPCFSSYEQEQTWILTQTMSNNSARYQSSIENIHLTLPTSSSSKTKYINYENINLENNRSVSLSPSIIPSRDCTSSLTTYRSNYPEERKIVPTKIITSKTSNTTKTNSISKKSQFSIRPMRVIHTNGELIVRI